MHTLMFMRTGRNHISTFKTRNEFYEAKLDVDSKAGHFLDYVLTLIPGHLRLVEYADLNFVAEAWPDQLHDAVDNLTHLYTYTFEDQAWFFNNMPYPYVYLHIVKIPESMGVDLNFLFKDVPESEVFKPTQLHYPE